MEFQSRERKGQLSKRADEQKKNKRRVRMVKMVAVLAPTVAKAEAVEEAVEKLELELNNSLMQKKKFGFRV